MLAGDFSSPGWPLPVRAAGVQDDGFIFAANAASARRGLIPLAISSGVVPLGTSFLLPSGSVTLIMLVVAV